MEKDNLTNTNEKYSVKELMIMKSVEKIKDPFKNLTVEEVAKDLKMGENLTNQ